MPELDARVCGCESPVHGSRGLIAGRFAGGDLRAELLTIQDAAVEALAGEDGHKND